MLVGGGGNGSPLQYFCWEIPQTEEPGGLQFMGSEESDMTLQLNHCRPHIGTCHGCLPSTSTRIKSCAAAAAALQHPLKKSRVESRREALCAPESCRTGLQRDVLRGWFYERNASTSSSLENTKILHGYGCFSWLAEASQDQQKLSKKINVLNCTYFSLTKITYILFFPRHLWNSFSEPSEVLSPRLRPLYCPK